MNRKNKNGLLSIRTDLDFIGIDNYLIRAGSLDALVKLQSLGVLGEKESSNIGMFQ